MICDALSSCVQEDMVLCQILDKLEPAWVTSYHEHDSLLEHIDDEELSEEERRAAWANYNQQIQTNKYVPSNSTV